MAAHTGLSGVTAYSVSKAGVLQLTRSLANEWAASGVRVNSVSPGFIPTPLNSAALEGTPRGEAVLAKTPQSRFGSPPDVSAAVVYLAGPGAGFVTGTSLVVDGGFLARGLGP